MNKFFKIFLFFSGFIIALISITFLLNPRFFTSFGLMYGPGVQDFSKSLTGAYNLYRNSAHEVFIAPDNGWSDEDAIIPAKVIKVNAYEEFIIAERQGLKRRRPNDSLDTYEIPDKNIKDYWILNTEKNYVLKNLKSNDFKRKLDSLKIPETELIDIYEY